MKAATACVYLSERERERIDESWETGKGWIMGRLVGNILRQHEVIGAEH